MRYALIPKSGQVETSQVWFDAHDERLMELLFPGKLELAKHDSLVELWVARQEALESGYPVRIRQGVAWKALEDYGRLQQYSPLAWSALRTAVEDYEFSLDPAKPYLAWRAWTGFLLNCGAWPVAFDPRSYGYDSGR